MNNILDYIDWRGDLPFSQHAFNEVDALIFSVIGYVEWDEVVDSENVLLKDACLQYFTKHAPEDIEKTYLYCPSIPLLIKKLNCAKRYKDIRLSNYVSVMDPKREVQFAAVTIHASTFTFISFRGTDSSILGWKEDFNMTFLDEVPSQKMAQKYVHKYMAREKEGRRFSLLKKKESPLYLGGHSKGGNLAMHAAICERSAHARLTAVYNFDGPGFRDGFYKSLDTHTAMDKICTYLPQESIIGRLLTHHEKAVVIQGESSGLQQHDAFYWTCGAQGLMRAQGLSEESDKTKLLLDNILMSKSDAQKEEFINTLFKVLEDIQVSRISDLQEINIKKGITGILELGAMSSEDRKMLMECAKLMWTQSKSILMKK